MPSIARRRGGRPRHGRLPGEHAPPFERFSGVEGKTPCTVRTRRAGGRLSCVGLSWPWPAATLPHAARQARFYADAGGWTRSTRMGLRPAWTCTAHTVRPGVMSRGEAVAHVRSARSAYIGLHLR